MYYVQTVDPKIIAAAARAEEFFSELIRGNIELPKFFTHTSDTPQAVIGAVRVSVHDPATPVRQYTTFNRWSNVLGYTSRGAIYVNTRFSNRADIADIAGNLAHEYCHILGYSHKGNRPTAYNLQTVPYVIGYLCRDFVKKNSGQL